MKQFKKILDAVNVQLAGDIIIIDYLRIAVTPEENTQISGLILDEVSRILKENPTVKFNLILDLSKLKSFGNITAQSRKKYAKMVKTPQILKAAVIGGSITLRTIISFVALASGRGDAYKTFLNKETALKWVEQK